MGRNKGASSNRLVKEEENTAENINKLVEGERQKHSDRDLLISTQKNHKSSSTIAHRRLSFLLKGDALSSLFPSVECWHKGVASVGLLSNIPLIFVYPFFIEYM